MPFFLPEEAGLTTNLYIIIVNMPSSHSVTVWMLASQKGEPLFTRAPQNVPENYLTMAHCPENAMAVNAIAAATVATRAADVILPAIQKFMATPDTIIDGK